MGDWNDYPRWFTHPNPPYPIWLADRIAEIRWENDRPKAGSIVEYTPAEDDSGDRWWRPWR